MQSAKLLLLAVCMMALVAAAAKPSPKVSLAASRAKVEQHANQEKKKSIKSHGVNYFDVAKTATSKMEQAIKQAHDEQAMRRAGLGAVAHMDGDTTMGTVQSPASKVVALLEGLKQRAEADFQQGQVTYDTHACWCEDKVAETFRSINTAKANIVTQQGIVDKLAGELGKLAIDIKQSKKDLAGNVAAIDMMDTVRGNENNDYTSQKVGLETSIGSLEGAITILKGAGTKKSFLDRTTHENDMLNLASQIRPVVSKAMPSSVLESDVDLLKRFIAKPDTFFAEQKLSAMQTGQNPFGDFAPQSDRLSGVLKGMYDAFTKDLEKANVQEAESQKAHEALRAIKIGQNTTLGDNVGDQEGWSANKKIDSENAKTTRQENRDLLAADEAFFANTKEACASKASDWSEQARLRTQEIRAITQAMAILQDNADVLASSYALPTAAPTALPAQVPLVPTPAPAPFFFQQGAIHSNKKTGAINTNKKTEQLHKVYATLKGLATKYKSLNLVRLAVSVRDVNEVDWSKALGAIDTMIATLRAEAQADIVERDRCEALAAANGADIAGAAAAVGTAGDAIIAMNAVIGALEGEITLMGTAITKTNTTMTTLTGSRDGEHALYLEEAKDDQDAVPLLQAARNALMSFQNSVSQSKRIQSQISGSFIQKEASVQPAANYSIDNNTAPDTSFSGAGYDGRASETDGISSILANLVEDIQKELAAEKADDALAQKQFEKQMKGLKETMAAQEAAKASLELQKAAKEETNAASALYVAEQNEAGKEAGKMQTAINQECLTATTQFEDRRTKRQTEMDGLTDAKEFLAGGLAPTFSSSA